MQQSMREKLQALAEESRRVSEAMSTHEVASDPKAYREYAKTHAELAEVTACYQQYLDAESQLAEARAVLRAAICDINAHTKLEEDQDAESINTSVRATIIERTG